MRHAAIRILLSVGVVALAATLAGLSTWASFTDSTSAQHAVSTGVVDIDLGAAGTAANRLDLPALNLAPGDEVQRALTLTNSSTIAMASVTLSTSADVSNALSTDATNGLQVAIHRCALPWVETPIGGGFTYVCVPGASTVLASRPISMVNESLGNLAIGAGGGSQYLRVRLELPSSAGNTFQALSNDFDLTFTGVQRTATNR